ncbi:MAG: ABC transporter ATP-binding protein [Verrucomicrobiota bacterium]
MTDPILIARGLSRTYGTAGGGLTVLRDVGFELSMGDSLAIVGSSGSGKTTLLGLCAGLDRPSGGEVILAGNPLGNLDEDARARLRNEHVGFIFQNFQLLPTLTALENVLVPAELAGFREAPVRGRELLQQVGLGDRLHHYPAQLSGGEQQRVALARAFINRPRLLLADEPTGNLDTDTARHIVDMIFDLNQSAGTALVLVTHDLELAARCRRQLRLKGGRVVSLETHPGSEPR